MLLRRKKTTEVKDSLVSGAELVAALAADKKFRDQLLAAVSHGERARVRAARRVGRLAAARRLVADDELRRELTEAVASLRRAWLQLQAKRSHRLRNTLLVLGGTGAAAVGVLPQSRRWLARRLPGIPLRRPRVVDEAIEVEVPVQTAYNQWTQFEDFPLFMEGVDHVQQLDDTRLHWVATIGGRTGEWDAKILEQHPDSQISWISEDGKKTRGTVSFEPVTASRTRVRLSMSYQAEGAAELVGSAAGIDARRIRGDLERFKGLIESRGAESGAWRGDVSAGTTQQSPESHGGT
jgi:uncharacterized membrane protein